MDAMLTELTDVASYINDIIVMGLKSRRTPTYLNRELNQSQQYQFCLQIDKYDFFFWTPNT